MIEDAELRELFQAESEEHLQNLDDGLLLLEANPQESAALEEVFRAAHSLKGAARMLGVSDVETLAHHLEDELGNAKRGRVVLSPPIIDRMCVVLDVIRKAVDEAVTGIRADIDINRTLGQLNGTVPLDRPCSAGDDSENAIKTASPTPVDTGISPGPEATSSASEQQSIYSMPAHNMPAAPETAEFFAPRLDTQPGHPPIPMAASSTQAALSTSTPTEPLAPQQNIHQPTSPPEPAQPVTSALQVIDSTESHSLGTNAEPSYESPEVVSASVVATPPATFVQPSRELTEVDTEVQVIAAGRSDFKIQTMRVPPAKLDALMTLASELTVTANRVNRGLAAFVEMSELWDEWNKDLANQRARFTGGGAGTGTRSSASVANTDSGKLAEFHEREQDRLTRLQVLFENVKQTIYEDVTRLSLVADGLDEGIRNVRLLPLSTIFNLFTRSVRDLARDQHKEVQLVIEGGDTAADKRILEDLKDPLMHMVRNSVDHGIETPEERLRNGKPRSATMRLRARQTAINLIVQLQDDGRGLNLEAIKRTARIRGLHTDEELAAMSDEQAQMLIFAPGFSTSTMITDVSGRGVGLDVVRTNIENLKGRIQVDSTPGMGCSFTIWLPLTLATTRVLLVEVDSRPYALPIEYIQGMVLVSASQFFTIEGRETVVLGDEAFSIARLSDLLELSADASSATGKKLPKNAEQICVIVAVGQEKIGLLVDALQDEQEVVLKPLGSLLKRVRNVSGATILGTGEICMVLNPHDLVKSTQKQRPMLLPRVDATDEGVTERRKLILLAEDSITTRTQEKRILESAGYEVVTAVDGADAFNKLATQEFDAVVSDVEMPNLDGLSLSAKIRENARYKDLPIILVTSLASDEDKQRGAEVGANAYITKGTFEQKVLLETLRRLV
jgi:two-component system chemotaxis sensor kinase CheA